MQSMRVGRSRYLAAQLRRYVSVEANPADGTASSAAENKKPGRSAKELPPVEIGGMTFVSVEKARQAEAYEDKRVKQENQQTGSRHRNKEGDSVANEMVSGNGTAIHGDEIVFTVPDKPTTSRSKGPKRTPKEKVGGAGGKRTQRPANAAPARRRPTAGNSIPDKPREVYVPDLQAPRSMANQGRYLVHNSTLTASLKHLRPPLDVIVQFQQKSLQPGSSSAAATLAQNGRLEHTQKSAVLDQLQALQAR